MFDAYLQATREGYLGPLRMLSWAVRSGMLMLAVGTGGWLHGRLQVPRVELFVDLSAVEGKLQEPTEPVVQPIEKVHVCWLPPYDEEELLVRRYPRLPGF